MPIGTHLHPVGIRYLNTKVLLMTFRFTATWLSLSPPYLALLPE
jgi:hypothetical protein